MKQKMVGGVISFLCVAILFQGTMIRTMAADRASWNEVMSINIDLNESGKITDEDATVIRIALAGDQNTEVYDVTGDGKVDVRDVVRLKRMIAEVNSSELNGFDNGDNGETSINDLFPHGDF